MISNLLKELSTSFKNIFGGGEGFGGLPFKFNFIPGINLRFQLHICPNVHVDKQIIMVKGNDLRTPSNH